MQLKFKEGIRKWLTLYRQTGEKKLASLTNFNLNDKTTLAERFKVALDVFPHGSNQVELFIPAFVPTAAVKSALQQLG